MQSNESIIANMGIRKIVIMLCLLCLSCELQNVLASSRLPETELSWKNVPLKRRPSSTHSLYMDCDGLIWVGTNNGLNIYDGVVTHPVSHPKLAGTQVYSIAECDGVLFLGTNHGLWSLDKKTHDITEIDCDMLKETRCMLLVDNVLWVGTLYGAFKVDMDDGCAITAAPGLPHSSTYSLLRDSRGIIYAGTFDGLARWDTADKRFDPVTTCPRGRDNRNLFVNCMLESDDGKYLYVGCEGNLYKYYIAGDNWEPVPELEGNNIKSIARIGREHLLVGTDNGIYDCRPDTTMLYRHDSRYGSSIADNEIWCVITDRDKNVWAGHGQGFSISSHSNLIRSIRLGSLAKTGEGNEIYCIHRDKKGRLWMGGTNGVLQLSPDNDVRWYTHGKNAGAISHNRVRDIFEDSSGTLWLPTDAGVNRYNENTAGFDVFHISDSEGNHNTNWVYAFDEDESSYWTGGFLSGVHRVAKSKFGADGGLVYSDMSLNADAGRGEDSCLVLENDLVNDIEIDRHGNVWILLFRDDVLVKYDPRSNALNRYNIYEMTGGYPSKIAKDRAGRIWCAFNGGAVIFSEDGESRTIRYSGTDGEDAVVAIGPVGDDMWVSTQDNMWRIDGGTLAATILPIPQKAYTAIYEDTAADKILLGGLDEILEIDPAILSGKQGLKGIEFMMVRIGDSPYSQYDPVAREGVTMPYGGSLSFIVSSLDYTPENVQRYMYKLADARTDTVGGWTVLPEGVNEVSLSDLKMGNYEILVKRVGMSGAPVSIPLKVSPPVLLSWWALLIYMVLAVGVILAVVVYIRRRSRRQFQEAERRKALESVERKLTFLSNISHDLKTPLSMIIGPVSLLRERTKDKEVRSALDTVYGNAMRLNNMIHKTIELRHLEDAEDNMLILSTFDIVGFCRSVFETFRESHPNKKFIFHSSCDELFIEGDAVKFESVMTNLLSNACKYSEDGATVTCGISQQADRAEIVVSDDGVGIEEADQPLVFQRMFRAPSTSKVREGTGLGLYLIRQYLELMHGSINLYSQKGQGSCFTVSLPVAGKDASRGGAGQSPDDAGKPRILIVEDNTEISAFVAHLLDDEYSVLTAGNGRSGLAVASSFLPDLIIVDEMMPIMSGLEMCGRMKQIPRLSSIPVIMLTAKTDNVTENKSVRLGIDVFMSKPFDPDILTGRIRHLLKSRSEIREKLRISALTETKPIEAESTAEKQLARIAKIIEENISDPDLNVNSLCEKCDIPQKQLYRLIKKYMDVAPVDYIRRVRLQKAAMLLGQKRFAVSEIGYMVGFKTPSYFAKCFQAQYGVKPSMYEPGDTVHPKIPDNIGSVTG